MEITGEGCSGWGTSILVADESPEVRKIALAILRHAGFAAESVASMEEVPPDPNFALVLLSSTLAAGRQAAWAKLFSPRSSAKVLITCSQYVDCPVHEGLGCVGPDCLMKPRDFTPAILVSRVQAALRGEGISGLLQL